ncbi:stress response translation initiation inhibitor YciH [Halomarina litorea]|uniref:stress response translation initiation inhibitor YciH n=1 Tax=Halomarina litorea TaxID=2961595 RepID=UPI0020C4D30A|nr:stress response translation initiation inhibitor YciH [Halomarina sp. BCD28]
MSNDLNDVAGLPDELGIGDDLARAEQRVSITVDTRRYGKAMTVVSGFDDSTDLDGLASTLKSRLAVGGTVTDGRIELQGDHGGRLPDVLREEGFRVDG